MCNFSTTTDFGETYQTSAGFAKRLTLEYIQTEMMEKKFGSHFVKHSSSNTFGCDGTLDNVSIELKARGRKLFFEAYKDSSRTVLPDWRKKDGPVLMSLWHHTGGMMYIFKVQHLRDKFDENETNKVEFDRSGFAPMGGKGAYGYCVDVSFINTLSRRQWKVDTFDNWRSENPKMFECFLKKAEQYVKEQNELKWGCKENFTSAEKSKLKEAWNKV